MNVEVGASRGAAAAGTKPDNLLVDIATILARHRYDTAVSNEDLAQTVLGTIEQSRTLRRKPTKTEG